MHHKGVNPIGTVEYFGTANSSVWSRLKCRVQALTWFTRWSTRTFWTCVVKTIDVNLNVLVLSTNHQKFNNHHISCLLFLLEDQPSLVVLWNRSVHVSLEALFTPKYKFRKTFRALWTHWPLSSWFTFIYNIVNLTIASFTLTSSPGYFPWIATTNTGAFRKHLCCVLLTHTGTANGTCDPCLQEASTPLPLDPTSVYK